MSIQQLQLTKNDLIETLHEFKLELISDLKRNEVPSRKSMYATQADVAKFFRTSVVNISRLTKSGKLKSYRLHGRILYQWDDVDRYFHQINEGGI